MTAPLGRVVIGGASGFIGQHLVRRYRRAGREVVTVGRSGADVSWDDDAGIARAVDGAAIVVGLAGKSVGCRYNAANRAEIFRSRLETTAALSRAIAAAAVPPPVWVNSSTATIYRHAEDRPQTESDGELGEGFSVAVAKAWEEALDADDLPGTRRVALRAAIVLGRGGALGPIRGLARTGLGGSNWDGRWPITRARRAAGTAHEFRARRGTQRFSWIHVEDLARVIDLIETTPSLEGPVNASTPNPEDNRTFMALVRRSLGVRIGPPLPRWVLEIGAMMIRTETELVLKSRWVLPEKLVAAGFTFDHPTLEGALRDVLAPRQPQPPR
ncbi:NAD-dependent epimerase [Serinibacter arcticus]|uniref:NAD-dependent epimerase n=1 Tax=Serinibacter arcticus TaxID=1655435 RepID=A0A2U1ZSJ7_9MICO|nr:DUF1731 domain-containing protein [Serinibacter arcticus]PWD49931.1 NAD-dependent epimerase [Serinibacter arcticus]